MMNRLRKLWQKLMRRGVIAAAAVTPVSKKSLAAAVDRARIEGFQARYNYPIQIPQLPKGVVPEGETAAIAMDSALPAYDYARMLFGSAPEYVGFPGYPRLAMLATRAEYRMFAQSMATQLTREWIVLQTTDTAGDKTKKKVTELTQAITNLGLRDAIRQAAEHDSYYGRGQIFLDIEGHDRKLPLILSNKTVRKGAKFRIKVVEAMWTTPSAYNALDPAAEDFYKPTGWWMLGQQVHATRLLTIIERPVPDMLKPAFNFGGMSMSQLAEPYVDNWLRTRQSVSDLINNFSIVTLQTSMDQVLQGSDDGSDLMKRAQLFTLHRSNAGIMLLDKEREDIVVQNVPLGGLHELQAQSQEQMCSVSGIPAVELLGISPTGFGNLAQGEQSSFKDRLAAIQENFWRAPIKTILDILQLIMYGEIDEDIVIAFQPLYQMTPKEVSEIRAADGTTDCAYVDRGILSPIEVRDKLARNPESGYQGIDVDDLPEDPGEAEQEENEGEENEDVP